MRTTTQRIQSASRQAPSKKEKCWTIHEEYPITVSVRNARFNPEAKIITVPKMVMTFPLYNLLRTNIKVSDDRAVYLRKTHPENEQLLHSLNHQNAVNGLFYDYRNGAAEFLAPSEGDLNAWLEKFNHLIVVRDTSSGG